MLLKFNEEWARSSVNGALAIRKDINRIVDEICAQGYRNICWLGIGGTWASGMQAAVHMKEQSEIETWAENASEYNTTGNKRVGEGTVVITSSVTGSTVEVVEAVKRMQAAGAKVIGNASEYNTTGNKRVGEGTVVITSSVTGSTVEVVEAVKRMQAAGAKVIGFIDIDTTELAKLVDYEIAYPVNEQLKFFMVADRFMQNNGEFSDCDAMYAEFEAHLAQALIDVEKKADAFGQEFAKKHWNDPIHYFVGAGNQWGATYSYAMCYWEEQLWIKTKSITSGEFFHGMFEIITKETPVTVFIGEDAQRPLSERVAKFLPRICENYTIIDTKDYELMGISEGYRKHISHLVMHAVNNRIDAYMERETRHPMDIRRYYRRLDY